MIWCVEDDATIRDIVTFALKSVGFEVRAFEDGALFWEAVQKEQPALVVMDILLPGINGTELLKKMKDTPHLSAIPVIMATAKGHEYDRIMGLDMGADDYLVKPFSIMELVSRVKAVLRRCEPKGTSRILSVGGLCLNLDERIVLADGERLYLTYKEFELLQMFLSNPGIAFTRDRIFERIWASDYVGDSRTVDMHIRTLRQKLGAYGKMIETVRSVGYRWESTI